MMNYIVKQVEHRDDQNYTAFLGKNESLSHKPLEVEPFAYKKNAEKFINTRMEIDSFIKTHYPDLELNKSYDYEIIAVPTQGEIDEANRILALYKELKCTFTI